MLRGIPHFTVPGIGRRKGKEGTDEGRESVKVLPSNHWKIPVSDWFTLVDEQKDVLSDMLAEKANKRSVSAVTANSVAGRHLLQYLRGKHLV